MLMSGEGKDERKENALKTSLDLLDNFLSHQNYVSGDFLTIADFAILASTTQLEGMDYRLSGYRWVNQSSLGSTHLVMPLNLNIYRKKYFHTAHFNFRNLHRWMEKLKQELPYYDECNTAGIEMFRNWAKARKPLTV